MASCLSVGCSPASSRSCETVSAATAARSGYSSLSGDDIADLVAYTTSRPRHVNLRRLVVLPTRQA